MKNRIRELRESRGLTQTDLGDRAGVTRQAIHAVERDKHDPSIRLAARIADALDHPIDEVFDLTDLEP